MNDLRPLAITPYPVKLRIEEVVLLDQAAVSLDDTKRKVIEGKVLVIESWRRPQYSAQYQAHRRLCLGVPEYWGADGEDHSLR